MKKVLLFYINGACIYALWVFLFLGFRESCVFSLCPELPIYNSKVLNISLSVLPDQAPFAALMAIGRGISWLPNLLLSLFTNRLTFSDWLFVRDAPSILDFYSLLDKFIP